MKRLVKDLSFFVKRYSFMVPLLLAAALAFGFQLTNFTYGVDAVARNEYLFEGRSIAQGRLILPLLAPLLNLSELFPFADEFLGLLALLSATILFCVVLKRASFDKFNKHFYTAFACLFITYPIITEYWVYTMMGWNIGLGYVLVAFSLLQMLSFFEDKKIWHIILAALMLAVAVSIYEALLPVYVLCVFIVLLVRGLFGEDEHKRFKTFCINGLLMAIPLVAGLALELVTTEIVISSTPSLPPSLGAANTIFYKKLGLIGGLEKAFLGIYQDYIVSALWYMPLTILWCAVFVFIAFSIVIAVRRKAYALLVLSGGSLFSLILLTLIQGSVSPYRCCLVFSFFTAFTFAIVLHFALSMPKKLNILRYAASVALIVFCFIQGVETNNWFCLNHQRYEAEMKVVDQIGYDLSVHYNLRKPVVFVGQKLLYNERLTDHIYLDRETQIKYLGESAYMRKIAQTSVTSMLSWSITAFSQPCTELYKIFEYAGYDLEPCTREMYNEARELCKSMPIYPKEGYIQDVGSYIIVRLDAYASNPVPES
ncbi:MAG: glucosyltransferase domain-containing protein [Clostridia bacterium]|nr:glucosyltransferase domain-containing protein [Clostridia bacterium]